ncbi:MAG: CU044_2847 family protein [Methylomonas sp.]|jgi:hypothetical protein
MSIIKSTEIINGEEITIFIESNPQAQDNSRAMRGNAVADALIHAEGVFGSGVKLVKNCAMQVVAGIQNLEDHLKPEELEVQLAIKLGSEAGAVLVKLSGEAQMQVTMKWKLKNEGKTG